MAQRGIGSTETIMTTAPIIRDIVVVGTTLDVDLDTQQPDGTIVKTKKTIIPKGEAAFSGAFYGHIPKADESPDSVIDRLERRIKEIAEDAAEQHKADNCDNGVLLPDKQHNITRLITNEFFFYTEKPLTRPQFQQLMQRIADWAATQPENLHLILGSFAVQTSEGGVMNVVPVIQCGPAMKMNFIVKSNPSTADHVYNAELQPGKKQMLRNISHMSDLSKIPIIINGKARDFSFDNVIGCTLANGTMVNYVIDICLDHVIGAGVRNFFENIHYRQESTESFCSHVVVSNVAPLHPDKSLSTPTHADPSFSSDSCNAGVALSVKKIIQYNVTDPPSFGTPETLYFLNPSPVPLISTSIESNKSKLLAAYEAMWIKVNQAYLEGKWDLVYKQTASEPERLQRIPEAKAMVYAVLVALVKHYVSWLENEFDRIVRTERDPDFRHKEIMSVITTANETIKQLLDKFQAEQELSIFKISTPATVDEDAPTEPHKKGHSSTSGMIEDLADSKGMSMKDIEVKELLYSDDVLDKVQPEVIVTPAVDEQSKAVDKDQGDSKPDDTEESKSPGLKE